MKTFEERYTAWVDGQLSGPDLASFEQELAANPDAATDRVSARKLGDLLRTHGAPALSNSDFFNLQLQQRIAAESPVTSSGEPRKKKRAFWSLPKLVCTGLTSLAAAVVVYFSLVDKPAPIAPKPSDYFAQVVEAWPSDPSISATTVYNPKDNVTVLWLDGLDYMPSDQLALQ